MALILPLRRSVNQLLKMSLSHSNGSKRKLSSGAIEIYLLNPVRAGGVVKAENWQWSRYQNTVGLEESPGWLQVNR